MIRKLVFLAYLPFVLFLTWAWNRLIPPQFMMSCATGKE